MSWGNGLFEWTRCEDMVIRTLMCLSGSASGKRAGLEDFSTLEERQSCRDCKKWWAWVAQCIRTSPFSTTLPKCSLAELQQQKQRTCLCEMLDLASCSERELFAFFASPSVDPAIYPQILLPLRSLHTHSIGSPVFWQYCSWRVSIYLLYAFPVKQLLLKAPETRSYLFYSSTRGFN